MSPRPTNSEAPPRDFLVAVQSLAARIKSVYALAKTADFQPEDQLKRPVAELLESAAAFRGLKGDTVTEIHDSSRWSRKNPIEKRAVIVVRKKVRTYRNRNGRSP